MKFMKFADHFRKAWKTERLSIAEKSVTETVPKGSFGNVTFKIQKIMIKSEQLRNIHIISGNAPLRIWKNAIKLWKNMKWYEKD